MKFVCAVALIAALAGCGFARAQQPDDKPAGTPTFGPNAFKLPEAPPNFDFDKRTSKPAGDGTHYSIQFGTPSGFTTLAPQADGGTNEGFTPTAPRISPANKDFYGLRLSTPIR